MTDNELIAEFMGVPKIFEHGKILWDTSRTSKSIYALEAKYLHYNTSWDWLMPVVEKIEACKAAGYSDFTVDTAGLHCIISSGVRPTGKKHVHISGLEKTKIQAVYKAVVQFIKWYNENKKP